MTTMKVTRYYFLTAEFDIDVDASDEWTFDTLDHCVSFAMPDLSFEVERTAIVSFDLDASVATSVVPNPS